MRMEWYVKFNMMDLILSREEEKKLEREGKLETEVIGVSDELPNKKTGKRGVLKYDFDAEENITYKFSSDGWEQSKEITITLNQNALEKLDRFARIGKSQKPNSIYNILIQERNAFMMKVVYL